MVFQTDSQSERCRPEARKSCPLSFDCCLGPNFRCSSLRCMSCLSQPQHLDVYLILSEPCLCIVQVSVYIICNPPVLRRRPSFGLFDKARLAESLGILWCPFQPTQPKFVWVPSTKTNTHAHPSCPGAVTQVKAVRDVRSGRCHRVCLERHRWQLSPAKSSGRRKETAESQTQKQTHYNKHTQKNTHIHTQRHSQTHTRTHIDTRTHRHAHT